MNPMYDPEAVEPMWKELEAIGIEPLTTAQAVEEAIGNAPKGATTLLIINSVCGCAAGGTLL